MRVIAIAGILAVLAVSGGSSPARANIEYPWCAVYGGDAGGASNCGFTTWDQCMATVSGIGGSCEPNQFYHPPAQRAPRKRKREQN